MTEKDVVSVLSTVWPFVVPMLLAAGVFCVTTAKRKLVPAVMTSFLAGLAVLMNWVPAWEGLFPALIIPFFFMISGSSDYEDSSYDYHSLNQTTPRQKKVCAYCRGDLVGNERKCPHCYAGEGGQKFLSERPVEQ